jgi:hypothetical protein
MRECRSYSESAMKILSKSTPGATPDENASGLTEVVSIFGSLSKPEESLKLLRRALNLLEEPLECSFRRGGANGGDLLHPRKVC